MAESTPPIVNIVGEKIALGPVRREVMAALDLQWGNDFAVTVTHGKPPGPVTAEMAAVGQQTYDVVYVTYCRVNATACN